MKKDNVVLDKSYQFAEELLDKAYELLKIIGSIQKSVKENNS